MCVVAQCVFMSSMAAIVFLRLECCLGLDNLHAAPFPLLCPSVPALSPGLCRSFPPLESRAEGRRGGGGRSQNYGESVAMRLAMHLASNHSEMFHKV